MKTNDQVREEMHALYASLPRVECNNHCGAYACGPTLMSKWERREIERFTGICIPPSDPGHVALWERNIVAVEGVFLHCPAFDRLHRRCRAYEWRPVLCRLWGAGRGEAACQFMCKASERMQYEEIFAFVLKAMVISGEITQGQYDERMAVIRHPEVLPLFRKKGCDRTVRRDLYEAMARIERGVTGGD